MEMISLSKLKQNLYILSLVMIFILLLTFTASAEFFQSGLIDYIQQGRRLSTPIFSPVKKIEFRSLNDTVVFRADGTKRVLEKNKLYFITQAQINSLKRSSNSTWGVQLTASSVKENAQDLKDKLELNSDLKVIILNESDLFKVVAGNFAKRIEAENLEEELEQRGYKGWIREIKKEDEIKLVKKFNQSENYNMQEGLNFYNAEGKKLSESPFFKIKGEFEAKGNHMKGEFEFNPLGDSVLFSYKTDLEKLTAYLLQQYFNSGAPMESLKAQAVIYRTSLLYQLETQGARLENIAQLSFGELNPVFLKAVDSTKDEILIQDDSFYYNSDFSLRSLRKPRAGIIPLGQADYDYNEILSYYYERAKKANLTKLLDRELKFEARIERGLKLKEFRQMSWSGPAVITVVDYNLKIDKLSLKPVLAQGIVPGREDLQDLIRKNSALAGVNGGYFHYSGRPLGLIYINGELVSEPLFNRTALLINKSNQISFAKVDWKGELLIPALKTEVIFDGVNRRGELDEAILFNHYYGDKMPKLEENYCDLVVRSANILGVEKETGSTIFIPPDGYVIRVGSERNDILNNISKLKNLKVELKFNFSYDFQENEIIHAVGGGPRLLKNGKIMTNGEKEHFQNDILFGRAPRTALALTAEEHLIMVTIDGRQSELSVGMTLKELAQFLKDLGAVEAMNLDGGGSARMVVRGITMSNPNEKRPISNGVIIKENKD